MAGIDGNQKAIKWIVRGAGFVGALTLVFGSVMPVIWPSTAPLTTASFDAALAEFLKQLGGALFISAIVANLFDRIRAIRDGKSALVGLIEREGIENVFPNSRDSSFTQFLVELIASAGREIRMVGLGHSYLYSNNAVIEALRNRLTAEAHLQLTVVFGSPGNAGLTARVNEEAVAAQGEGLEYDADWPTRFRQHVNSHLLHDLQPKVRNRVKIGSTGFCPMMMVINVDDTYLFAPYGAPKQRGGQSPWICCKRQGRNGHYVPFLSEFCDEAVDAIQETT